MADSTTPIDATAILRATEAQAFISDFKASCRFYTDKLGFTVAFVAGDPPFYGQFARGGARLNVRVVVGPVFAGDIREREHLLTATFTIASYDEIERLFQQFRTAGVLFHQELRAEPWGAATFVVCDPDANLILFAGPAE